MATPTMTFAERAAQLKAKRNPLAAAILQEVAGPSSSEVSFGNITLNEQQAYAVELASKGKSFVLTGAAGTGKTTTQAAVVEALEKLDAFETHDFKYLGNAPSIAIVAFTKVAVRNIQKAVKKNPVTAKYAAHCMTIHTLLEFCPEEVDRIDSTTGDPYTTKMFMPQRHAGNPLKITHLIIEEASMVGLDLWKQLHDALLPGVQIIYLGDINQLPPVFGLSVMSYALCKLPVVELTHVYRQALDNPIIANAHRILRGEMVVVDPEDQRFTIVTGNAKHKIGQDRMSLALTQMLNNLNSIGDYNEHEDIILIPFNKQLLGTKSMNEKIATFLGKKREAVVHNVKAGFNEWFLAVGDKVLVEKQAAWIVDIQENPKYFGKPTKPPALWARDGTLLSAVDIDFDADDDSGLADYADFKMEDVEDEDMGKRAASHIVTIAFSNPFNPEATEEDINDSKLFRQELRSAGEFRDEVFQFGYCMSVHKSQGSEWRKVFFIIHYDFAMMLNREMMYTAITRAREELVLIGKEDLIEASIKKQRIAGTGLQEKILHFNGGALADLDSIPVTKDDVSQQIADQLRVNAAIHLNISGEAIPDGEQTLVI